MGDRAPLKKLRIVDRRQYLSIWLVNNTKQKYIYLDWSYIEEKSLQNWHLVFVLLAILAKARMVEGGGVEEEGVSVVRGVGDDGAVDLDDGAVRQCLEKLKKT